MIGNDDVAFGPEKEEMLKTVVGELLELAPSTNVKKVIGAYSFAKAYSTNLEKLKNLSNTILEECAIFLKLVVRDENNANKNCCRNF